ncbi:MAG TPA: Rrf2 family transcriptional regulator [Gammaproteobacteria bacterium]|nr:Rrf2 family transcriptional regulator [Gammaproteobacteria bacterium]
MQLTTKGRYAVTAMLDLALHTGAGPVTLSTIAQRQQISLSYLEQLFSRLRKEGLVTSMRGPGGGYSLARETEGIAIADIISAINEPVDNTRCHGTEDCNEAQACLTHHLWCSLSRQITDYLAAISLADLMNRKGIRAIAKRQDQNYALQITRN